MNPSSRNPHRQPTKLSPPHTGGDRHCMEAPTGWGITKLARNAAAAAQRPGGRGAAEVVKIKADQTRTADPRPDDPRNTPIDTRADVGSA